MSWQPIRGTWPRFELIVDSHLIGVDNSDRQYSLVELDPVLDALRQLPVLTLRDEQDQESGRRGHHPKDHQGQGRGEGPVDHGTLAKD